MDWKELIEALGSALTEVEEDQRRQQQQREQAEAAGAAAAENDKNNEPEEEEEEEGGEDLKAASVANAIQTMNHKLIEIHSRLKSFDEEASDIPPSSSGSQEAPLSSGTVEELVLKCRSALYQNLESPSHTLAAQLLAELGRGELGRGICLKSKVIEALDKVLAEQIEVERGGVETTVQICRILGNLCYNCNDGREQVMKTSCLQHICQISKNKDKISSEDPGQRFPVILPGFLLNFCSENQEAVSKAGEVGFVDVIVGNILATQTNDAVFNSSLNFLVTLAEEEQGHVFLKACPDFAKALNHILVHTTSPEVTETSLELIRSIAEDSELTLQLAQSPLCTTLIKHIVGKWRAREFEDHRSDACDLLVLILSHDACMKFIYTADNGKYLQTFISWLRKDDMQLKVTAGLAIGNFACNDEHTTQLMENKTSVTLIGLLKQHQNVNGDLKLQHALLGTVRNLAVNAAARKQLLEQGILDPCLRLTEKLDLFNAQPVIFKLLQTLRFIIDGNPDPALKIGNSRAMLAKLVEWGAADAQGIKSEAGRLLAALIKHSGSREVMTLIVDCGGLPHVTTMLMSSHVRMLNEALIALTVLSATLPEETVHSQLHTDLVINSIKKCLEQPATPVEVKLNSLTFTKQLLKHKTAEFTQMLKDMDFKTSLVESEKIRDNEIAKELLELLS